LLFLILFPTQPRIEKGVSNTYHICTKPSRSETYSHTAIPCLSLLLPHIPYIDEYFPPYSF
jgi:hypothetical protein